MKPLSVYYLTSLLLLSAVHTANAQQESVLTPNGDFEILEKGSIAGWNNLWTRDKDAGRDMIKVVNDPPERVIKFQVGHQYRLPLWELVYHDCMVAQWYWGDYNNKLPSLWDRRDLFNILYGTPPMFMINSEIWNKNKDRFARSYKNVCPLVRQVGYEEMTDHSFLISDRSVQQTSFSGGTVVTVNFGEKEYTLETGEKVGPMNHLVKKNVSALKVEPVPSSMNLSPFYRKYVNANGYPIVGSEKVSDYAMLEAGYIVNMLLAKRSDVREAMIKSGSRLLVMAYTEFTTDIPEHSHMTPKDFWDRRARGLGGSQTDPICSCAEENVLGFPGDPYDTECILIHEFAHNMHLRGLINMDPTFDARVKTKYDAAMAKGLWKDKYAAKNHHEYFAEGVQSWFDNNRPPDHDHNHVNTRAELKEYDPGLAELCEEMFGDTVVKYTKPATRLTGHMAGYNPENAPTFTWPEHLQKK